eukprot:s1391_g3.t1
MVPKGYAEVHSNLGPSAPQQHDHRHRLQDNIHNFFHFHVHSFGHHKYHLNAHYFIQHVKQVTLICHELLFNLLYSELFKHELHVHFQHELERVHLQHRDHQQQLEHQHNQCDVNNQHKQHQLKQLHDEQQHDHFQQHHIIFQHHDSVTSTSSTKTHTQTSTVTTTTNSSLSMVNISDLELCIDACKDALVAFWQNASGSQNISAELGTRENLKYIEEISCITLHSKSVSSLQCLANGTATVRPEEQPTRFCSVLDVTLFRVNSCPVPGGKHSIAVKPTPGGSEADYVLEQQLTVVNMDPFGSPVAGGKVITVHGVGFPQDVDKAHIVLDQIGPCEVLQSTQRELTCITPYISPQRFALLWNMSGNAFFHGDGSMVLPVGRLVPRLLRQFSRCVSEEMEAEDTVRGLTLQECAKLCTSRYTSRRCTAFSHGYRGSAVHTCSILSDPRGCHRMVHDVEFHAYDITDADSNGTVASWPALTLTTTVVSVTSTTVTHTAGPGNTTVTETTTSSISTTSTESTTSSRTTTSSTSTASQTTSTSTSKTQSSTTTTSALSFLVEDHGPQATSMAPTTGPENTTLVIHGHGLGMHWGAVYFVKPGSAYATSGDASSCDVTSWQSSEVHVRVPYIGDAVAPELFIAPLLLAAVGPVTELQMLLGSNGTDHPEVLRVSWCCCRSFGERRPAMAGVRARIAYRFTFIDEEDDNRRDGAGRVQARSLSPLRTSVANSEALVVDAWAQRHLRTLRQGQDATVFDALAPNRGSDEDDAQAQLLSLLAELLRERAEQDGLQGAGFVVAVMAVHAGLPCALEASSKRELRKHHQLRQVVGAMNFSSMVSLAARYCEGSRAVILQEAQALRNSQ